MALEADLLAYFTYLHIGINEQNTGTLKTFTDDILMRSYFEDSLKKPKKMELR